jgi:general secretion pathway protein E
LRSGILAVVSQRLARKLCDCATSSDSADAKLGLPVAHTKVPRGCDRCHGTGYRGRILLAEMLTIDSPSLAAGILARHDAARLEKTAIESGMPTRWNSACKAVDAGLTSAAEVRRVLGLTIAVSG